jgi:hypothetical protein
LLHHASGDPDRAYGTDDDDDEYGCCMFHLSDRNSYRRSDKWRYSRLYLFVEYG